MNLYAKHIQRNEIIVKEYDPKLFLIVPFVIFVQMILWRLIHKKTMCVL